MKKQRTSGFKGFGNSSAKKYPRYKSNGRGELKRIADFSNPPIDRALQRVDATTQRNQSRPSALENFKKLVKEGNTEKLTEYFKQYGIAPDIARLSLSSLIQEELIDLSSYCFILIF